MSLKKVHDEQPKEFEFSNENMTKVDEILKKYPAKNKKSAVMPLLYLAQKQNENWIPLAAIKYIANYLSMPYISVYEVATFTLWIILLQWEKTLFKFAQPLHV